MDYSGLIVLGSGQAGASLARPLAPSGKLILLLYCRDGSTFQHSLRYHVESDPDVHGSDPFRIGQCSFEEGIHNRSLAGVTVFLAFGLRAAAVPAFLPRTLGSLQLCHSAAP